MKRFASHFLFLPQYGYLRQYAVEVEDGYAVRIFPLVEEVESAEWLPGVIALFTEDNVALFENQKSLSEKYGDLFLKDNDVLNILPPNLPVELSPFLVPCLFFPFDFTTMQPVAETRHRLLQ